MHGEILRMYLQQEIIKAITTFLYVVSNPKTM